MKHPKLIVIAGPTASGKTSLGVDLALKFNGEIISADSRQVYKGLDIGSGKVTPGETKGIPHHLIDILNPEEKYSVYKFKKDCLNLIQDISSRGKIPIIVGGTGLYIESVVEQYKFSKLKFTRKSSKKGLRPNTLVLNLRPERDQIRQNIQKRLLERWNNPNPKKNLKVEVQGLINSGVSTAWLKSLGLEYKYIAQLLEVGLGQSPDTEQAMLTKLNTESWRFAKRQITFLKRWYYAHQIQKKKEADSLVEAFLSN
jgi:tRNA A37 N6-isopentenylltransferase MiaA